MVVPVSIASFGIYMTFSVTYICHSPLLIGCVAVMWWQWSYHFTLLFALVKMIVSHYMPQSTRTVHVGNYNHFYQCTTTVYSTVSKRLVFLMICSFNKQPFYLLCISLHIIPPYPMTLNLSIWVYTWTPNLQCAVVIHCIAMSIDVSASQKNNT